MSFPDAAHPRRTSATLIFALSAMPSPSASVNLRMGSESLLRNADDGHGEGSTSRGKRRAAYWR